MQVPVTRQSIGQWQAFQEGQKKEQSVSLQFGAVQDTTHFTRGHSALLKPDLSLEAFKRLLSQKTANVTKDTKADTVAELTEVLDQYLQGVWTEQAQPGKRAVTIDALRTLTGARGQGYLAMAQINPTVGDLAGNARKIMRYIRDAEAIGLDSVLFPEGSLFGYPMRDVITRYPAMVDENLKWLEAIAEKTGKTKVLLGFVEPRKVPKGQQLIGKPFYNSVAVLSDGKIQGIVRKSLLPNYAEFDDWRTFESAPAPGVHPPETLGSGEWGFQKPVRQGAPVDIHGRPMAVSICEDIWNPDSDFFRNRTYRQDPISEILGEQPVNSIGQPEVLLNISASPSRSGKEQLKQNLLSHTAKRHRVPVVYVNQVGAIDENSFDGASRVYDQDGRLVARAKSFREQFMIANPVTGEGKIYPLVEKVRPYTGTYAFNPYDDVDLERTYHTLVQGIRDYFMKRGYTSRAIYGSSGGLDSAVTGVLLADALGPENTLALRLSSKITSSESERDAKDLARHLGNGLADIPIRKQVKAFEKAHQKARTQIDRLWGEPGNEVIAKDNMQARTRAVDIWAEANRRRAIAIATCDKSEIYMGYTTIGGDQLGELAPIADLPKTKVRALAAWLNRNQEIRRQYNETAKNNVIPANVIQKPSGAELTPKITNLPKALAKWESILLRSPVKVPGLRYETLNAEDALMPYEFLDEAIQRFEGLNQSKATLLGESFWYERKHGLSPRDEQWREQKKAWLDKFFMLDNISQIKRWLGAPQIIVSDRGISKNEYRRPITGKPMGDSTSLDDIREQLNN
jgi:NAD+ synthetase